MGGTPRLCELCNEPAKIKVYSPSKKRHLYYCTKHAEEILKRIVGERAR